MTPTRWQSATRGRPLTLTDLVDAFDTERRLLEELREVLLRQRDGLSRNDLNVLDESVYSARRVLRTLEQARMRRRTLLSMVGDEGASLNDLEVVVGPSIPDDLVCSRDMLVAAADCLSGELRLNRRVIDGTLDKGDLLLRAFSGNPEGPIARDPEPEE